MEGLRQLGLIKKEGVFSLPHCGGHGACLDITKSSDSQTNIDFSENDWIIAEILQKHLSNEWRNKKVFGKTQIGWRQMPVASQLSRNNFLVTVLKIYTEADFKVSQGCPILLHFFTYFQIFCPGW